MIMRFMSACVLLFAAVWLTNGKIAHSSEKSDMYFIAESPEEGSFSFDAPLQVRHNLAAPTLKDYKVRLKVSVFIRDAKASLTFTEDRTFMPPIQSRLLPHSSHVELVLSERKSIELPLTSLGGGNTGIGREVDSRGATVPLYTFREIVGARPLRGQLYWRSDDGEVIYRNELRFFTLDEKALRTVAALDAKTR